MTEPEPPEVPDYYLIPREETGVNVRPSGTQEDFGEPPFGDLFTDQVPTILGEIRQFFVDWPAHIKAGIDTGIDWLQAVADLQLEWLRTLLHKIVDTTAEVFDVSSWVAFLDTAITSAANLVANSFATVFDWIASLLHGAVRFAEHSCNLDLTWLHSVIDDLLDWSTTNVDLTSQSDFIDGINGGGFWSNIVDWMLGGSGSWLDDAIHAITNPINNFFDDVRRFINQMIEPWRIGYFDTNWAWVPALTTPTAELPGGGDPVLTPGSNDGDGGALAPGVNNAIPAAPKNVSAIPFWDILVSGFPAGNITYAIAAVKGGVEGPATQVSTFVGTLFPPNSSTHVDLRWDAVSGASSYRVYRKVDGTYQATGWRLVASPTSAGTLLAPVVDNTPRSGGSVAAPKTDAELAAQIVTDVQTTAGTAITTAGAAQATVDGVIDGSTQVSPDTVPTLPGTKIGSPLPVNLMHAVPSGHVAAIATELLTAPDFGVAYGDNTAAPNVTFGPGWVKVAANGTTTGVISKGVAVAQGQIVNVAVEAAWTGLAYTLFAPIRFDIVGYRNGLPAIVLTLADLYQPAASGSTAFTIVVQVGNDIDTLCLRPTVGPNATAGTVTFTKPKASHSPIISSNSIGSVDYKIVTNPLGRNAQGDSIGYALQSTLNTFHQALGGDGDAVVPADVATLLNISNQTAIQALQLANANADLIETLQQQVADLQSVPPPPPPSTFTPTMRKFASPGSFNYAIPAGATTLSILCLGGGGASGGGGTINLPGSPGLWSNGANVTTWDVATLLAASVTNITGTVGSGGVAGNSSQGGSTGYGTSSTVNGVAGYPTISGSFGWANGVAYSGDPPLTGPGPSPSSVPLPGGFVAYGGGSVGPNTKGASPGGAGGGAKNFFSDLRANGAPGAVWIVAT